MHSIMPRVEFTLRDRNFILKLICTTQMTYSSFITLVYFYLTLLQSWTLKDESERTDIMKLKWMVIGVSVLEFGLGTLLSFAANMRTIRRRRPIVVWVILETLLVPISICLLMQLYYRLIYSKEQFPTDPHYSRVNVAQVCFLLCQFPFIGYVLDFLTHGERKPKVYDPRIRPESVYAPTDPKITTTESRHIRMSQSFLFQPSSSKAVSRYVNDEELSTGSSKSSILLEKHDEIKSKRIETIKEKSPTIEKKEKQLVENEGTNGGSDEEQGKGKQE